MNKLSTRQKILLVLLSIVVFFWIYVTFVPDKPIPHPGGAADSSFDKPLVSKSPVSVNKSGQVSSPKSSGQLKKYDGKWGNRDPFYRKVKKIMEDVPFEETLGIVLTGVQWINGKAIAVINNTIYREGDVVDGKKITRIEKNYIVLRSRNKEYILRLGSE